MAFNVVIFCYIGQHPVATHKDQGILKHDLIVTYISNLFGPLNCHIQLYIQKWVGTDGPEGFHNIPQVTVLNHSSPKILTAIS